MSASTQDILNPFDPTGYITISGADLLQYLTGASPFTDKGMIVMTEDPALDTPDVPNASVTTKWARYLWLRVQPASLSITVYAWNPNIPDDPTYMKWVGVNTVGIAINSLNGNVLIDNTVTDSKIVGLDWSKLSGTPPVFTPSGAASGDLTGTYPGPTIAVSAVTTAKINDAAVTTAKIGPQAVDVTTQILPSGTPTQILRTNSGATAAEWFTSTIATDANVVPAANALKVPQVNSAGTAWQMAALSSLGRILQTVLTTDVTADTTALTAAATVALTTSNTKQLTNLFAIITPISATSTLIIEVVAHLTNSADTLNLNLALFQDVAINAIAAVSGVCETVSIPTSLCLTYKVTSGSLTARTFYVGFSGSSGNTRYNSTDGSTVMYGGTLGVISSIKVTEYL